MHGPCLPDAEQTARLTGPPLGNKFGQRQMLLCAPEPCTEGSRLCVKPSKSPHMSMQFIFYASSLLYRIHALLTDQ